MVLMGLSCALPALQPAPETPWGHTHTGNTLVQGPTSDPRCCQHPRQRPDPVTQTLRHHPHQGQHPNPKEHLDSPGEQDDGKTAHPQHGVTLETALHSRSG
ncbi:hypothetical protein E2C01_088976 [Portunus trituberculatus]|uniref:Uncharacterized protein n=1 Tax=Portunus trituberculatus TaxID=210409 RepID=A0A5B7J7L8_PORTR|nr:hypothetical protein [Portunus trituberculatus]